MKLSIVIICWNDFKVIQDCLRSIYTDPPNYEFEVIVSDNGSTDASLPFIREKYPQVRLVENGANLGFARGNNAGIRHATGEYVLILNPDTIIHPRALQNFVDSADRHPQSEAFGCRVLNRDGTNQNPARPLPTVRSFLISALCLRGLGHLSNYFESDTYVGWDGKTERQIGFQYGCCMLFRRPMLEQLGGFDERFFYHFEEVDLCCRVWKAGYPVLFCPEAEITHLGGQSVGRAPVRFKLETYRNRYRYFNKHFGAEGARQIRLVSLLHLGLRYIGLAVKQLFKPSELNADRLNLHKVLLRWNWALDPIRFLEDGSEPESGYAPLMPPPVAATRTP